MLSECLQGARHLTFDPSSNNVNFKICVKLMTVSALLLYVFGL